MKLHLLRLGIFALLFLTQSQLFGQTPMASDTLNRLDANQKKQGYWIIKDKITGKTIEEGYYSDNLRNGIWKYYFPSGKVKSTITYISHKPNGPAKLYYENGTLAEEGTWIENKWVGKYKMYYPNGSVAYDWNFDVSGKRTGIQKYFYDNGNPMYEGEWKDGKNSSNLAIFDDKGQRIGERVYNETGFAQTIMNLNQPKDSVLVDNREFRDFNLTGNSTIVNFNGKVDKSGYFEKGKLMNGTEFEYDEAGTLIRKKLYRNGEVFKIIEMKKTE